MAITLSDDKQQEWEKFKTNGGSIIFEIDSNDISSGSDFEEYPSIQPRLTTGFELPPTSLINTPMLQALIQLHGSTWDYILCRVYLAGGKIIYRKKSNNKYEATCIIPKTST